MGASCRDRTFVDEFIQLDGKLFEHCVFDGCVLAYDGGATFVIGMDCTFIDTELHLAGVLARHGDAAAQRVHRSEQHFTAKRGARPER